MEEELIDPAAHGLMRFLQNEHSQAFGTQRFSYPLGTCFVFCIIVYATIPRIFRRHRIEIVSKGIAGLAAALAALCLFSAFRSTLAATKGEAGRRWQSDLGGLHSDGAAVYSV